MKLGKLSPRHDLRTLQLAHYLEALPPVLTKIDWTRAVTTWPMMANDAIGDCTCAAAGHMIQGWTANAFAPLRLAATVLSDAEIIAAYSEITGYKPSDPSTDQGAVELDVLNYWRKTGIGGHKIGGYVALEPENHHHVEIAVDLFGGCYIGLALPLSAQQQRIWSLVRGPNGAAGSWGGHAVPVLAYDHLGVICITWGSLKRMTWAFWDAYCDESYAILSPDWIENTGTAPSGLNMAQLSEDLQAITK